MVFRDYYNLQNFIKTATTNDKGENMSNQSEFFHENCEEKNLGEEEKILKEEHAETEVQKLPQFNQITLLKQIYFSGFLTKCNLTGTTKLVLFALAEHYNSEKEEMFPSQKYLANQLGISEKSVERSVKELAEQGFITYTTKRVNRYKFTIKFFNSVKMSDMTRQNVGSDSRQNVGQTYKKEQRNYYKNNFKNFNFYNAQNPEKSCVPSVDKTRELLEQYRKDAEETVSPLDYNEKDALNWLKKVPKILRNSFFATSLLKKYNFDPKNVWNDA